MSNNGKGLPEVLANQEADLLADWIKEQAAGAPRWAGTIRETELRDQSKEFLSLLKAAVKDGSLDINGAQWSGVRGMLVDLSRSRGVQGFSPSEIASFVFSLKKPLCDRLRREFSKDPDVLAELTWTATQLLDNLGLYTTEIHQKAARGGDRAAAAGDARAVHTGREAVGGNPGTADDRNPRQRTDPDCHGVAPAANRRDRFEHRHY